MLLLNSMPVPSWVESGAEKLNGLDLLGLRLQVQQIGETLLDGVTTITPSIRYLSFRSWIILSYVEARLPNDWAAFSEYASRVEAAIALGNLLNQPGMTGLLGSNEAGTLIAGGEDPIQLKELVQQLGINVYAGPSEQLGLSFSEKDIPGLTSERGLPIARFLQRHVAGSDLGNIFSSGKLLDSADRSTLREFGQVTSIQAIPEEERWMLIDLLMPRAPQSPQETARLSTYTTLLALAEDRGRFPKEQDLFDTASALQRQTPIELEEVIDGWLRYIVRNLIAVTHEAVLGAVLRELEAMSANMGASVPGSEVIRMLVSRISEHESALRILQLLEPGESPIDIKFREIERRVVQLTSQELSEERGLRRWLGTVQETEVYGISGSAGAGALAILPIAWILARRRVEPAINENNPAVQALSSRGWARMGLREVIFPQLERFHREDWKYQDVMVELAHRTLEQHLRISWARMKADPQRDVALLSSDGENWTFRKSFKPGRTASRIREASNWLGQLGLLGTSGLTDDGKSVLNRSIQTLRSA